MNLWLFEYLLSKFFEVDSHSKKWKLSQFWKRAAQFLIFKSEISTLQSEIQSKNFISSFAVSVLLIVFL